MGNEIITHKKDLLKKVINTSPELIFVKDNKGRYILVNKAFARIYNTEPQNMINKTDWDLVEENIMLAEKVKTFVKTDKQVRETQKEIFIEEEPLTFPDGEKIWIQTRKLPLNMEGNPNYILGVVQNITELKQAEKNIEKHREHLKLINKILRHDLTNNLISIKSGTKLLKQSSQENMLGEILKYVNKSLELIAKMRELEIFISSHPELKPYKLRQVFEKSFHNIPEIEYEINGRATIYANETIYSVVDNLLKNAVIHGDADFIQVDIIPKDKSCLIKVADNGKGIPDSVKDKIFEEGFKHGKTGHSGLGLFIVKKAIENFGGFIYVDDNKPKGTVFVFSLRRTVNKLS